MLYEKVKKKKVNNIKKKDTEFVCVCLNSCSPQSVYSPLLSWAPICHGPFKVVTPLLLITFADDQAGKCP